MTQTLFIICFFTFLIHLSESLAYCMRLAGVRTKQIAIAMSFVTSTLLVSRLSNMFQAPLMGNMVDTSILEGAGAGLAGLEWSFRIIIFSGFIGSFMGAFLAPTAVYLFQKAIHQFLGHGSLPKIAISFMNPMILLKIIKSFRFPRLSSLKSIEWKALPKQFLILNVIVTSIYTIGVLCALLAGAYLPDLRATAIQLSGIVNGIATILLTLLVDPPGARVTDQAYHGQRPESHVRSVVFFLQMGRLFGVLVVAQLLFKPFTYWIMWVTRVIGVYF